MSFFGRITSNDEVESLATELAILYIKKSGQEFSRPKDIAREFVKAQEIIAEELNSIRLGK